MTVIVLVSLILVAAGIGTSAYALKKDSVRQGLYGHLVFYLYLFAVGGLILGLLYGLSGFLWIALIFVAFGWLITGRVLTFLRLFNQLTYLHLAGGIVVFIWIIINLVIG